MKKVKWSEKERDQKYKNQKDVEIRMNGDWKMTERVKEKKEFWGEWRSDCRQGKWQGGGVATRFEERIIRH